MPTPEHAISFAYQGLVIASAADNEAEQSDLVLLLREENADCDMHKLIVYGVSKQAFIPPTTELDFLNIDYAKNRERRFATPLKFGDIIQWNDEDCNHETHVITGFKREKPMYEVSSCAAGHLLKLGGVIQPNKPTTFWTPLQTITIPVSEATRAESDVWLHAWCKVDTTMTTSSSPVHLDLTFIKFEECDFAQQGRVGEAPWHKKKMDSKFTIWAAEPSPVDSDDDIAVEPPKGIIKHENKWAEIIQKQLGLYVGERLLVCQELPQFDFILPLLMPLTLATDEKTVIYPSVGEYFHFSAIWSNNHRSFLVRDMIPYYTLRNHIVTQSGNLCVRVNHAIEKGLFIDHDETLGLIDDPHHCLSFFEFHPMNYESMRATVEVRAVRATENKTVRYRIVRPLVDDDYMDRYQEWIRTHDFSVGPINGVLINRDTVVSASHPNIFFRFQLGPEESRVPYGSGIRFRAKRQVDVYKELLITEWRIAPEASVKVMEGDDMRLFQVVLKNSKHHKQLAWSTLVGLVDTRSAEVPDNSVEEYRAWIRESPFHGDCRRAATIMEVYSTRMKPTVLKEKDANYKPIPNSASSSSRGSQHGSYHGSKHSKQSSTTMSTSRFVGPRSSAKKSTSNKSESTSSITK